MSTARFSANEKQTIKIIYTVKTNREFHPEDYDTCEDFDDKLAELVMGEADGEIDDWEIEESDTNDTMLLTNTEYCILIRASVRVFGSCGYDPGRLYGPMEDCYPPEIYDVEYEEGMITSAYVSPEYLSEVMPEIDELKVIVCDVDGDSDIEFEDD